MERPADLSVDLLIATDSRKAYIGARDVRTLLAARLIGVWHRRWSGGHALVLSALRAPARKASAQDE